MLEIGLNIANILTLAVDRRPGHHEAGQGGAELVGVRGLPPGPLLLRAQLRLWSPGLGLSLLCVSPLPGEALTLLQSAGGHPPEVRSEWTQAQLPPPPLNLEG